MTTLSMMSANRVPEGQYTNVVYIHIQQRKYSEAMSILQQELLNAPNNRAALSLLAHCQYQSADYASSMNSYQSLSSLFPEVSDYKLYYAQSAYKAGMYAEAEELCSGLINESSITAHVQHLLACIAYEREDVNSFKEVMSNAVEDSPEFDIAKACLLYREGEYEDARIAFNDVMSSTGWNAELAYSIALCYYHQKQYNAALQHIAEIIETGIREHPQLSIGSGNDAAEMTVKSVGNSTLLKESALIEAFNLKAAIEYQLKNFQAGKDALADMPPRLESELDPVTLHNRALLHMNENPTEGFRIMTFLLTLPSFPIQTFSNLLLLYIKYEYFDLAADVLAENPQLHTALSQHLYEFLEAVILSHSSAAEAYRKLDILATRHIESLRTFTKNIQEARLQRDQEALKTALSEYDDTLEVYMPVLMSQAKLHWDLSQFFACEKLFQGSAEFCSEHKGWQLNVAHVFFMQENKYRDAIRYYEPEIKRHSGNLLDVQAIVLANLCVAYIMTSQNEEAEEVMRQLETEEEKLGYDQSSDGFGPTSGPTSSPPCYHLCIVNLVIGTLYCAKGNYEFGMSRIIKSFEPMQKKLGLDTWYYAKRALLSLSELCAKHMLVVKDEMWIEMGEFLDSVVEHGESMPARIDTQALDNAAKDATIASEARLIQRLLQKLQRE